MSYRALYVKPLIEFLGTLTQAADRWVYAFESVAMLRLTR